MATYICGQRVTRRNSFLKQGLSDGVKFGYAELICNKYSLLDNLYHPTNHKIVLPCDIFDTYSKIYLLFPIGRGIFEPNQIIHSIYAGPEV
jgi:hypothetical protein